MSDLCLKYLQFRTSCLSETPQKTPRLCFKLLFASPQSFKSPVLKEIVSKMESKANSNSHIFLFGFSFNLILTLGSLGFTCYSLQRLDSRLIAVEQNLRMSNPSSELGNRVNSLPTITHPRSSGAQMEELVRVKRAADRSSLCRKCSNVCAESNENRSVSAISQSYTTI